VSIVEHPPAATRPPAVPRSGPRRLLRALQAIALLALPAAAIAMLAWPMLSTPHALFGGDDWLTHVWYVWHQGDWMRHHVLPTYYINYSDGVFYPQYAFYGGTLYAFAGGLSAVLGGNGLPSYITWWILAMASAYGGFYWLGRQAGLGRWAAQAPPLVFTTSAYYITMVYARGDWAEFIAISTMPLVAAASISVVRARRLELWPAAALAASMVLFSGSHNITLLYGGIFLLVTLAALLAAVPAARRMVTRAAALRWLGVAVPAVLVNAWFLIPLGAYQHLTKIGAENASAEAMLNVAKPLVQPDALFTLHRVSVIGPARQFVMALPVLAIAWVLVTLVVVLVRRAGTPAWRRTLVVLVVLTAALTAVMMDVGLFLALPAKAQLLQFTYRLESFVLMGVAGALIAALVLARDSELRVARPWTLALVPILAFALIGAHRQVDRHPLNVFPTSPFSTLYSLFIGDFADGTVPELDGSVPRADFRWDRIHDNRMSIVTRSGPGQNVASNLLTIPPLVHVDGAKIVGAATVRGHLSDSLRQAILKIDDNVPPGPVTISVRPAHPWPVVLGKTLSVLGLLGLLANFVAIGVGARRRRRAAG
jgi:hypothetical protein